MRNPEPAATGKRHQFNGKPHVNDSPAPGTRAGASANAAQNDLAEPATLKLLLAQLSELREFVALYALAKLDHIRASLREVAIGMVWGALGFVAIAGMSIIACWFVLSGFAQGFEALTGAAPWLGNLLTGLLALAGIDIGMRRALASHRRRSAGRTVAKYETRASRRRERERVAARNAATPSADRQRGAAVPAGASD